ncbi:VWA domain-containing protein [bacterium]|nr:VWA domain-containing protein [candidate division CSSED10-310 bacterium]
MRYRIAALIGCLSIALFTGGPVRTLDLKSHNLVLVIDSSNAMNKHWNNKKKIDILRDSLKKAFEELNESSGWGLNMGIRAFGTRIGRQSDTSDTWAVTKVEWFDPLTLSNALDGLKPSGKAPVAVAIREAEHDIPPVTKPPWPWNAIILLTASGDDLDQDVLAAAKEVRTRPVIDGIYILGLNLNPRNQKIYEAVASETKGYFENLTSPDNLTETLVKLINERARPASVDMKTHQ